MTVEVNNEAYIAGALLLFGEQAAHDIRGIISRDDFQVNTYGAIFSAAESLLATNEPIDPVSIRERARRDGVELLDDFIKELMDCVPTLAYCVEYAHRVAEDAQKRRIKELATRIQEDDISSSDELLAALQRETEVIRGGSFQKGLLTPSDTLRRFTDHVVEAGEGRCNFISSGFLRLDQILGGGFIRGGLYILSARPAVGKSTYAINLADNIKGNCLLVSLEMTPEQITSKRVSRLTGLSSAKLLSGRVSEEDWTGIAMAVTAISEQGVFINDRCGYHLN